MQPLAVVNSCKSTRNKSEMGKMQTYSLKGRRASTRVRCHEDRFSRHDEGSKKKDQYSEYRDSL
jgi:hypothetical protein